MNITFSRKDKQMLDNTKHILGYVNQRIKKNKNVIMVINGATGSGKSYGGVELGREIAEMFGTNFSIKENVGFEFKDLLKKTMMEKNKAKGTVFLFEEVGAFGGGASSREWQSKANKFFFSFMQTTRHRNQVLIFTCPNFANLDAGARQLVHINLVTRGIDFKNNISYFKPYFLQINTRTGKTYFKYMRFKGENKPFKIKLKQIGLKLPTNEMIEEYEKIKTGYTTRLNETILNDGVEVVEKIKKGKFDDAIIYYLKDGCSPFDISNMLPITERTVYNIKRRWEFRNKQSISGKNPKELGV